VGHFQRRAIPPQPAPDGSLAPIDVEGATAPGRQPIAREVGRIHFDRITAPEPQATPNRHIDGAAAADDETSACDFIVRDFQRRPVPPDAATDG